MSKGVDRGAATRRAIIETATRLFTEAGYDATSIEAVLAACGMSRGALYHHFPGKESLFTAVLEDVEARLMERVAAAGVADNPLDALRAGCAASLAMARDPTVRQVVLIDAPAVVGWAAWREIDGRYGFGLLKAGLAAAAAAGRMREDQVEVRAHLLLAVLIEMAMLVARAEDGAAMTASGQEAVEGLLSGWMGVAPDGAW